MFAKKTRNLLPVTLIAVCILAATPLIVYAQNEETTGPSTQKRSVSSSTENVRDAYRIGISDNLAIQFYSRSKVMDEFGAEVRVDGTIYIPVFDTAIKASGMRLDFLEEELAKLAENYYQQPKVVVRVTEYRSKKVTIGGAVNSLVKTLEGSETLIDLIAEAGGLKPNANSHKLQISRKSGTQHIVDYNNILKNRNHPDNILLLDGDTVYVPFMEEFQVLVWGKVMSQGPVTMIEGMRLMDAIAEAKGMTEEADLNRITVIRRNELTKKEMKIHVNFNKLIQKAKLDENIELKDGDIIFVPKKRPSLHQLILKGFQFISPIVQALLWYRMLK